MATINGTNNNDELYGTVDADTINGRGGHDILQGRGGADTLNGGDGYDTARYTDSSVGVAVNLATGRGFGGSAEGDVLTSIEGLIGSYYNDYLVGDAQYNEFYGHNGADILDGGEGGDLLYGDDKDDTLKGGGGDDILDGGHDVTHSKAAAAPTPEWWPRHRHGRLQRLPWRCTSISRRTSVRGCYRRHLRQHREHHGLGL